MTQRMTVNVIRMRLTSLALYQLSWRTIWLVLQ